MLPKVSLEGRLTRSPELKFTQSGAAVASFGVACNDRRKNPQTNEWEDGDPTFLDITCWRDMAENVAESLHRGDLVVIEGRIAMRKYTNKDNVEVTTYGVTAETIGPSLRWDRATVHKKADRGAPTGPAQQPADDPWATTAPAPPQQAAPVQQQPAQPAQRPDPGGWGQQYDEPPF